MKKIIIIAVCTIGLPIIAFAQGDIIGTVQDGTGPVAGAQVYIYGTDFCDISDASGHFTITDIPEGAPRYIVCAEKNGYYRARVGDVDVVSGTPANVTLTLKHIDSTTSFKSQILDVRICYIFDNFDVSSDTLFPDPNAVLDTMLYPDSIKPYLESGEYMDVANADIQLLAEEILLSLPDSLRTNQTEVAKKAYLWVCSHVTYDIMSIYPGDVTCGNWQTVNGGWGKNFSDWCWLPEEVIVERRTICIEFERFTATLLRALRIPARPAPLFAHPVTQWWVQLPSGDGYWANMETSNGSSAYAMGDTLAKFPSKPESAIHFWMPNSDAPIHNNWDLETPTLWREETRAGSATLYHDAGGLAIGDSLIEAFANTGNVKYFTHGPTPDELNYEVKTRGFQFDMANLGTQTSLNVDFPMFINTAYHSTIRCTIWTNRPEWVTAQWHDTLSDARTHQSLVFAKMYFEFEPISLTGASLVNGDFEFGGALPANWGIICIPTGSAAFERSDTAKIGAYSGHIVGTGSDVASFVQSVPVSAGDVIRIDGWVRVRDVSEGAQIEVSFPHTTGDSPPYPNSYPSVTGTQGWTKIWASFVAPDGADSATILCILKGTGEAWFDDIRALVSSPTSVEISEQSGAIPNKLSISAYPNPFNSSVVIQLSEQGAVAPCAQQGVSTPCSRIEIFDIAGRMVAEIPANGAVGEGLRPSRSSQTAKTGGSETAPLRNEIVWQPDKSLGSGVYLVRVKGTNVATRIVYMK